MAGDEIRQDSFSTSSFSFYSYLKSEFHRGYLLENDEERYAARREKVYTFFKIPRELEKFLAHGVFQCMDSFLFVLTFLPIRFLSATLSLFARLFKRYFRLGRPSTLLKPAEIVDLLKGILLVVCCYFISYIDTSVYYHIIKTQSTIKLYLFFNMLEIADRLMSAFGQDTLDALFWTATEPKDRKREHLGLIFHSLVAIFYVGLHSFIVLLQALCLNVAINSDNKGLLTIVISNNFIELKGSVFKKFDRNNLLQITCSDVRERFHLGVLLFVVVIQTMKEYSWKEERLWILLPDCFLVLGIEVLIDWVKHAFITRFNNIGVDAYRDYNILIASDLIMCKQKHAYSDHSDLVARRMGFIPLPLGVVIFRIMSQALSIRNTHGILIIFVGFLCLLTFRILSGIVILGKACDWLNKADIQTVRSRQPSENVERTTEKPTLNVSPLKCSGVPLRVLRKESRTPTPCSELPTDSRSSTPQRIKSGSFEDISLLQFRDMVQTVIDEPSEPLNKESKEAEPCFSSSSELLDTSSCSSPTIIESLCSESEKESEENKISSLTFLGESDLGLMANSMVSLDNEGLGQSVQEVVNVTNVEHLEHSTNTNRLSSYDLEDLETPSFEITQSCPCFSDLLTTSSTDPKFENTLETDPVNDTCDLDITIVDDVSATIVKNTAEDKT